MIRNIILALTIVIILVSTTHAAPNQMLVFVTNVNSQLAGLSTKELRRVYLGLFLRNLNVKITPIRNHSSEILHEMFLQKIMFMSSRTYERQLNLRTIRKGLKPPRHLSSHEDVIKLLMADHTAIVYMWESQAQANPNIRILRAR